MPWCGDFRTTSRKQAASRLLLKWLLIPVSPGDCHAVTDTQKPAPRNMPVWLPIASKASPQLWLWFLGEQNYPVGGGLISACPALLYTSFYSQARRHRLKTTDSKNISLKWPWQPCWPIFSARTKASGLPSGTLIQEDMHRHLGDPLSSGVQQRKLFSRFLFPFLGKPSHTATTAADTGMLIVCTQCTVVI